MTTTDIASQIKTLEDRINYWLTAQCDHASVRRALNFPASGKAVVIRIRGAFWAGTSQREYCSKLGESYESALATLNALQLT